MHQWPAREDGCPYLEGLCILFAAVCSTHQEALEPVPDSAVVVVESHADVSRNRTLISAVEASFPSISHLATVERAAAAAFPRTTALVLELGMHESTAAVLVDSKVKAVVVGPIGSLAIAELCLNAMEEITSNSARELFAEFMAATAIVSPRGSNYDATKFEHGSSEQPPPTATIENERHTFEVPGRIGRIAGEAWFIPNMWQKIFGTAPDPKWEAWAGLQSLAINAVDEAAKSFPRNPSSPPSPGRENSLQDPQRAELFSNVILCGKAAEIPGLCERLKFELETLTGFLNVVVSKDDRPELTVWRGATAAARGMRESSFQPVDRSGDQRRPEPFDLEPVVKWRFSPKEYWPQPSSE
ncbi:hypothetical protein DFJ73DRAFT_816854 [Zopfochytrium polystomum]|nr:hypothetical protein DFJ73DRAFT_816854 [Zopfochytrium polystomum]